MLLASEGVLPWVEDPMKPYLENDTIEGVASIHGDIHEGQHHKSFEKKHHLPQQMSFPSLPGIYVKPVCSFRLLVIICNNHLSNVCTIYMH